MKKKYKYKINVSPDDNLIIPEYKIHLLSKNKKIIKKIENFQSIQKNEKKISGKNNVIKIDEKKKKQESTTVGRTLWIRRKRKKSY